MDTTKLLTSKDFEAAFGEKFDVALAARVDRYEFKYEHLTPEQRDLWLLEIVKFLSSDTVISSGTHRINQWEEGWGENLAEFKKNPSWEALTPRYFGKYPVVRWRQDFIKPLSAGFEQNTLSVIQHWIFSKFLRDAHSVYEFGCGTGHNLQRIREVNPKAKLYGLDWVNSSAELVRETASSGLDTHVEGGVFNVFEPDRTLRLDPQSAVVTVAALEQIGKNFGGFLSYLFDNKPAVCVYIEPVGELLSENNLLDFLSVQYFRKRNYLSGFLDTLRDLEKQGKVVIHDARRTYIGSLFIEGYSVVVRSPIS
jgi:SAM-dependent methyltransferase